MDDWVCVHLIDGCNLHVYVRAVIAFTKSGDRGSHIYCIGMTQFLVSETVDEIRGLLGIKT